MPEIVQGLKELLAHVERLRRNASNLKIPLKDSADYQLDSLERNFEAGGRPPWKLLKTGGVSHLDKTGTMRGSNKPIFSSDGWEIVNTDPISLFHLRGTKTEEGNEKLPVRDWMLFQPEDVSAIGNIFLEHLIH